MAKVILTSGGLDSFIMHKLYNFDTSLFVLTGEEHNKLEWEQVQKIHMHQDYEEGIIREIKLDDFALDNNIIPHRNAFFVLLAAQFGNEIYMGATAGDTTKDKDYVFKAQMESLLNYFALDKDKVYVSGYPYVVHMPFKDMTKTEIVRAYLAQHWDEREELWTLSRSCYESTEKECGTCRSCLRKYVALKLNHIYEENIFEYDPETKMGITETYEYAGKKGRGKEVKDIADVIIMLKKEGKWK